MVEPLDCKACHPSPTLNTTACEQVTPAIQADIHSEYIKTRDELSNSHQTTNHSKKMVDWGTGKDKLITNPFVRN